LCLSTHLSLDETRNAPTITWSSDIYKEGEKYTLIMYDPNSVTTSGTYIHWVLINISGNSASTNTKNNIILPYFRPKPPDYKEHCYTFELYSQGKKMLPLPLKNINRDMSVSRLKTTIGLGSQVALTTVRFQGNPNARKLTSQKGGTRRRCGRGRGRGRGRSTRTIKKIKL